MTEVEHGSFSPLVFSTSGGIDPNATVVYKIIATIIAKKRKQPYTAELCSGFGVHSAFHYCVPPSYASEDQVHLPSPD